ncbi:MAG: cyclase family protein [Gemmatimonadota bacterium]
MRQVRGLAPLILLPWIVVPGNALTGTPGIDDRIVDLTHVFDEQTVYWPTARSFELEVVASGQTDAGFWYAANNISLAEHGGTHVDAPVHFAEGKRTVDEIPVEQLIGPAVVIDVRTQAASDPDYRLSTEDIEEWESDNGRIPDGAIVLMLSGWGERWPDKQAYLGTNAPGDVDNLHFPGYSAEAAEFLRSERSVDAVGVDTPSIDHGQSTDFTVHRILSAANIPGLENVANLDRLPLSGATVVALPMKIGDGSGAPARIIAFVPQGEGGQE